jgi:hypothetical protein
MKLNLNEKNIIPRVLICTPTSDRHRDVCLKWLEHLNTLNYPNFDVCLVENTLENTEYYEELKKHKVHDKEIIVLRHEWDPKLQHPVQMLADAREKARKYFLENKYDYLFWIDDDIFIPKNGIQRLLSYNKDCVGFYVHVFPKNRRKPYLLKSGEIIMGSGLDFFKFK